ncbi:MAG TPA: sigma-70 family RNA polymerase sigma factor [Gammaproteobacteria bacterium]|nr:sigma-70 family RNA polymerase sigma factor [Gammaproteobacteria bacterium]
MATQDLTLKDIPESKLILPYSDADMVAVRAACASYRFEDVYSEYHDMIFRLAYRLLGHFDDALELTQDVFMTVYRKLDTFRGEAALKTWLYRIVANKAANRQRWWRVRRRGSTVSIHELNHAALTRLNLSLSGATQSPEQACAVREVRKNLQRCLDRLPFKYRMVLLLRDIEEMTYEEIGNCLGLSLGTVKSRIARAREQLRELMDSYL